jgi:hypothetical protein
MIDNSIMPFVSTIGFGGIVGFFAFFTFPGPVDRIETLGATNSIFSLQQLEEVAADLFSITIENIK